MGVPSISAQELRTFVVSPGARTPSGGAPDQAPTEAAPVATEEDKAVAKEAQPKTEPLSTGNGVRLRVDADTNRIIAQIVDKDNKVVRQVPPEEVLRIEAKTRQLLGLLFDQKA